MRTRIFVVLVVVFVGAGSARADLICDSGHHIYSEGSEGFVYMYNDASAEITGGSINEFYMYNNSTADVSGGYISVILGQDTSSVNIYAGSDIYYLRPNFSSIANVYEGTIAKIHSFGASITNIYGGEITRLDAEDLTTLYLYTNSYQIEPTSGTFSHGLITGTWVNDGGSFSIDLFDDETISHVSFIPEPSMFLSLGVGSLMLRYKKS